MAEFMHAVVRAKTRWLQPEDLESDGVTPKPGRMGRDYHTMEQLADQFGVDIVDSGEIAVVVDDVEHYRDYVVEPGEGGMENFCLFLQAINKLNDDGFSD